MCPQATIGELRHRRCGEGVGEVNQALIAATTSTLCLGVSSDHMEGASGLSVRDWLVETLELLSVVHRPRNVMVENPRVVVCWYVFPR
jgi:hypothetical protein